MPYSSLNDIKKLVPEKTLILLTDDSETGSIDEATVTEAIASADAEIDAYCRIKYHVPFAEPPSIIKKLSVDIAIYNLYSRRGEEPPSARRERYRNAVRILEAIALGAVALDADNLQDAKAETPTEGKVFSRKTLTGF